MADNKWQSEEHQSHYFYVHNVFMELYNIFSKAQQTPHKNEMHENAVKQGVIRLLQDEVKLYDKRSNCSDVNYLHYVLNLPTNWDEGIRDSMIRPLFIQAGLINQNDIPDKLIFLTRLKSTFEYFHDFKDDMKIEVGQQHAVCSLDFDDKLHVDLDLVSVHYPSSSSVDSKYVIKSLNPINFTIPLESKDLKTRIKDCLERQCTTLLSEKLIDMLAFEIYVYKGPEGSLRRHDLVYNRLDSNVSKVLMIPDFLKIF